MRRGLAGENGIDYVSFLQLSHSSEGSAPLHQSLAQMRDPAAFRAVLRFKEAGLAGLVDAPHPGQPRTYGRDVRERILARTLTRPEGTTHQSTRRLAREVGVWASTVARVWHEGGSSRTALRRSSSARTPSSGPG